MFLLFLITLVSSCSYIENGQLKWLLSEESGSLGLETFTRCMSNHCFPHFMEVLLKKPLLVLAEYMEDCSKSQAITDIFRATFLLMIRDALVGERDFYQSLLFVIDILKEGQKEILVRSVRQDINRQFQFKQLLILDHLETMEREIRASPQLYRMGVKEAKYIFMCIESCFIVSVYDTVRDKTMIELMKPRKEFNPDFLFEGPRKL